MARAAMEPQQNEHAKIGVHRMEDRAHCTRPFVNGNAAIIAFDDSISARGRQCGAPPEAFG